RPPTTTTATLTLSFAPIIGTAIALPTKTVLRSIFFSLYIKSQAGFGRWTRALLRCGAGFSLRRRFSPPAAGFIQASSGTEVPRRLKPAPHRHPRLSFFDPGFQYVFLL